MRWKVDVTSLEDSKQTHSYCVEAESWQGALQNARRIRGDESRMAGFSIDITNDGCKAVDPAKKLRYEVKRAPDDAPLTPGGETPPPSKRRNSGAPPRPSKPPAAATPAPAVVVPKPKSIPPPAPATAPAPSKRVDGPGQTMKMAPVSANVEVPPMPAGPAVVKAVTPPIAIPPILVQREQEPTADVPLTYREYGFAFAAGTTEDAAARALGEQLTRIQGTLTSSPAGKLVNLAAFDAIFQGRPTVLPLATLTWKDWKPEPSIAFPRRARAAAIATPAPTPAPAGVALTTVVVAPAPAAAPLPMKAEPSVVIAEPLPSVVIAPEPAKVVVAQQDPFSPPPPPQQVVSQPPPSGPTSQTRSKPPVPKRRVRGEELISVLFESMHDLHFLRDSIEGGDFCLTLALEKLPSRLGLVYLYDIDRREFVVVSANGAVPVGIVGKRLSENEATLSSAMRKRRALVLAGGEGSVDEHAAMFGGAKCVLLAPVMQAGRFLGIIEMADPSDAVPFTEIDANAITYMAEQYAEFVAARGVLLDRPAANAQ